MKKMTCIAIMRFVVLLLALSLLSACMPANPEPTAEPSTIPSTLPAQTLETLPTQPKEPVDDPFADQRVPNPFYDLVVTAEAPRDAAELMVEPEDMPTAAQQDFPPIPFYESEQRLVFVNYSGVFVYDLTQRKIVYSVDFMKAFGMELSYSGSSGVGIQISQNGQKMIVCHETMVYCGRDDLGTIYEPWYSAAYYIDLETGTYYKGPRTDMEGPYVLPDEAGDRITSVHMHGPWIYYPNYPDQETSYDLFAEYMAPEDYKTDEEWAAEP